MEINSPQVVAEVLACSEAYEKALGQADYDTVIRYFWNSELALRFGVNEELYGYTDIAEFQNKRTFSLRDRKLLQRDILSFGDRFAVVNLRFSLSINHQKREGRQTQFWARIEDQDHTVDWRVVSAHVSHRYAKTPAEQHILGSAAFMGLVIDESYFSGIEKNLADTKTIVDQLMDFDLPDDLDEAGVFKP